MIEASRRRILSSDQVRLNTQPVRVGDPGTAEAPDQHGTASVREVRNASGDITEIHVQCECGHVVVVQCDYAG